MVYILILALLSPGLCLKEPETVTSDIHTTVVSWYGQPFHGRLTSCGETYDMNALSCASPTLPPGTRVRLVYGKNQFVLRVNDAGPFATDSLGMATWPLQPHPTRGFDLSRAAFDSLTHNLDMGIARVRYVVEIP